MQREFQLALLVPPPRTVGFPIPAVPKLHRAAAILSLRNGPFEIAVIQRMVFHLDCQPLVVRIERGAARDRPGFKDAVELEPQIVMQPARIMLLDHETPLIRRFNRRFAAGLRGLFEIAFFAIGREVPQGDDQNPTPMKKQPWARQYGPGTKTLNSR